MTASYKSIGKGRMAPVKKSTRPSSPQEELERVIRSSKSPWSEMKEVEDEETESDGDPDFGAAGTFTDPDHRRRWSLVLASASNDMEKFVVAAAEHIASTPEAYASFEASHRRAVVRSVGSIIAGSAAESDVEPAALLGLSSMDPGMLRVAVRVAALLRKNKIELTQDDVEEAVRLAGVEAVLES